MILYIPIKMKYLCCLYFSIFCPGSICWGWIWMVTFQKSFWYMQIWYFSKWGKLWGLKLFITLPVLYFVLKIMKLSKTRKTLTSFIQTKLQSVSFKDPNWIKGIFLCYFVVVILPSAASSKIMYGGLHTWNISGFFNQ